MIVRAILAVLVFIAVVQSYDDNTVVPLTCIVIVAAGLAGHVLLVRRGNVFPLLRAWILIGCLATFVYLFIDRMVDKIGQPPGFMSLVATLAGGVIIGIWSLCEERTFWSGCRTSAEPKQEDIEKPCDESQSSG